TRGKANEGTLDLSLHNALARGLKNNLGLLLAEAGERAAAGSRWQSLSALLPTLSGHISRSRDKINLEAYGFPVAPGESPLIGPFNVFDARLVLSQKLFDYSALEHAKAGRASLEAARANYRDARDLVVEVVTRLYLGVISDQARLDAADAELTTARALYRQAQDRESAGTAAKIEVLRAQVELEAEQQKKIVAANDLEKDKLALARAIGLPLAQRFKLSDDVPYAAPPSLTFDRAFKEARAERSDLAADRSRLAAARAELKAARGARLPSLELNVDWGTIGPTPSSSLTTYDAGAVLAVPLFTGGRVHGRVLAAEARAHQAQERLNDTVSRIEYQVRSALLDLDAASHRVTTAATGRKLAREQLAQARDRFSAGVTNNLEVVQAQQAVAAANESYIASLFVYNLAKVSLARALGVAEAQTTQFLKGSR
ncbi:MAG TPA: TolC family protein, partial [Thermoanaerobaculia bacterium]|nr:TolC family protein [Thermoanaerobaculia bacterium]